MTSAALEAALGQERPRRRRLSGMRGLAAGAALGVVAHVAARNAPRLTRVPSLLELTDGVRDRLAELLPLDEEEPEAGELEDEEPEDEESEEPEDEESEEPEDEESEEPEDYAEEAEDEE